MKIPFRLTKLKNRKTGIVDKKDILGLSCVNENLSRLKYESVLEDGGCHRLNLKLLLNKRCAIKHLSNFKITEEVVGKCSIK